MGKAVSQLKPRVKIPSGQKYLEIKKMFASLNLATVCQEARCPNIAECWEGGTATLMLMGDVCTRGCRFCSVKTGNPKGVLDEKEPEKVCDSLSRMGLDYVVLTSVDRDDLPDEGAEHFGKTVRLLKEKIPKLIVEVLTPDFKGKEELISKVVSSGPDVYAHNVETVRSLQKKVRDPRASYDQSLNVLNFVKSINPKCFTKTSLMLGLGETSEQIHETLTDLRKIDCDIVTFGQYLQPKRTKLKVEKYYSQEEFDFWKKEAEGMGFLYVASGPLVRSSYKAGEFFIKGVIEKQRKNSPHLKREILDSIQKERVISKGVSWQK